MPTLSRSPTMPSPPPYTMPGRTTIVRRLSLAASSTNCSCSGRHDDERHGIDGRVFGRRLRRRAEHPDAGRVDDEALGWRARARRARAPGGRRDDRLERGAIDRGPAPGVESSARVDVAVLRFGGAAKRLRIGQIADDRCAAARGDSRGLLIVAHERGHIVPAAHERVEHGRADVSGRARQKDSHRGRIS